MTADNCVGMECQTFFTFYYLSVSLSTTALRLSARGSIKAITEGMQGQHATNMDRMERRYITVHFAISQSEYISSGPECMQVRKSISSLLKQNSVDVNNHFLTPYNKFH